MSSATSFRKHVSGNGGAYSSAYHELLGKTPWVVVRRLLQPSPSPAPQAQAQSHAHDEQLSEGDVATVFSQFGDVVDVRFVRHRSTGAFLGTAFVCFADYRSSIAAADAMNSDAERGEYVTLTTLQQQHAAVVRGRGHGGAGAAAAAGAAGIVVERCDAAEVPAMGGAHVETYAQWLQRRPRHTRDTS